MSNVLIIVNVIAALAALSGFQPFAIAGSVLALCYLPGFSLCYLVKKDDLAFEDFILALPLSVGISGLLTMGLLYLGIHVKFVMYIIILLNCMVIVYYIFTGRRSAPRTLKLTRHEKIFLAVALMATMMLSIPVLSDRIAISTHGFHHSTMATQVMNGIFPPQNPGMGGTKLSYHWGYHAFLAAIAYPGNYHPLRVMSMLNVISLFFIFCIAYRTAKYFNFSEGYRYLFPLAVIGLMRTDAVIYFLNKIVSGNVMDFAEPALMEKRPLDVLQNWVWGGGAPWFDRRLFFMNKFYNANSMPLGILLCLSYFLILFIYSEKKFEDGDTRIYSFAIGLVVTASCLMYPPLAIVVLLHVPLWAGIILLFRGAEFRKKLRELLEILVPYGIGVAAVMPYLLSVSSIDSEPVMKVAFWDQSIRNMVVFWLPSPVIVAGFYIAFKKNSSRKLLLLMSGVFLCFSLSTFTRVALWNSGKFTFILSFFYALFFVYTVSALLHITTVRWLKAVSTGAIIIFLLCTPLITEASYIASPWFRDTSYSFSGRHIVLNYDRQRDEAFAWIRSETPEDSLLLLTYVETLSRDDIAQNITYEPAALSERNVFVVKDWYTVGNPEYARRVRIREKLLANASDADVRHFLKTFGHPLFLLFEENLPPVYVQDTIFRNFPENPEGFLLTFRNDRYRIYRVENGQ
jgi:hypothetical protein